MSGSPPRFHWNFPLALSLPKGAETIFQQPAKCRCTPGASSGPSESGCVNTAEMLRTDTLRMGKAELPSYTLPNWIASEGSKQNAKPLPVLANKSRLASTCLPLACAGSCVSCRQRMRTTPYRNGALRPRPRHLDPKQGPQLGGHFGQDALLGHLAREARAPYLPVGALHVVGQHDATGGQPLR